MKSKIGIDHIQSNGKGRITQALPGGPDGPSSQTGGNAPSAVNPTDLVAVVVHVERDALDTLMEKGSG